jgi:signal transduction histidine kinase
MKGRPIAVKLTLAFVFVGLLGAALVALYVGLRTQVAFNRFVFDQQRTPLVAALTAYYAEAGTWVGVGGYLRRTGAVPLLAPDRPLPFVVTTVEGRVVFDSTAAPPESPSGPPPRNPPSRPAGHVSDRDLAQGVPLEVEGEVAGYVIYRASFRRMQPGTPEAAFIQRVRTAIVLSAVSAAAVALLLGVLLARTLTRPIRALTAATRDVARGDLGRQVTVTTGDELGELAASFNQMSRDLARTHALRRRMTADIAHDLRTPLSVLLGYTEALSEGKLRPKPETYAVMHREAQHLNHLVQDLRLLSLADAGELSLNRIPMAPAALLERAAAAHWVRAEEAGITLAVEAPRDLPKVAVDPERMAQVLNNLVTNALRYTPAGGTITLSAEVQGDEVVLRVRDTGSGIASEDLPNVFERFYRGEPARAPAEGSGSSSGLGLAIVKSLVEAHGGAVAVESAVGEGTVFTIRLGLNG